MNNMARIQECFLREELFNAKANTSYILFRKLFQVLLDQYWSGEGNQVAFLREKARIH